jgi:peroxiredoxin
MLRGSAHPHDTAIQYRPPNHRPPNQLPSATLKTTALEDAKTDDLFAGKKAVLFAVPGAFTPTCSRDHVRLGGATGVQPAARHNTLHTTPTHDTHATPIKIKKAPGFIKSAADLKAKGVDLIACVSVNDAFVMKAWADSLGAGSDVVFLADGNGDFTKVCARACVCLALIFGLRRGLALAR